MAELPKCVRVPYLPPAERAVAYGGDVSPLLQLASTNDGVIVYERPVNVPYAYSWPELRARVTVCTAALLYGKVTPTEKYSVTCGVYALGMANCVIGQKVIMNFNTPAELIGMADNAALMLVDSVEMMKPSTMDVISVLYRPLDACLTVWHNAYITVSGPPDAAGNRETVDVNLGAFPTAKDAFGFSQSVRLDAMQIATGKGVTDSAEAAFTCKSGFVTMTMDNYDADHVLERAHVVVDALESLAPQLFANKRAKVEG